MAFRGNGFELQVLSKQSLLYLFLSKYENAVEFSNIFNYPITKDTMVDDISKRFEVIDCSDATIDFYDNEPNVGFLVKDLETGKEEWLVASNLTVEDYLLNQEYDDEEELIGQTVAITPFNDEVY